MVNGLPKSNIIVSSQRSLNYKISLVQLSIMKGSRSLHSISKSCLQYNGIDNSDDDDDDDNDDDDNYNGIYYYNNIDDDNFNVNDNNSNNDNH